MKTWSVEVSCAMTYEIIAVDEEEAKDEAIGLFLSDVIENLDLDVDAAPLED